MQISKATIVVTGAASGLGAATAEFLAARGAHVTGLDLPQALEHLSESPTDESPSDESPSDESPSGVTYLPCDITDGDSVRAALTQAAASGRLDAVVHCAGVLAQGRILGRSGTHDLGLFARTMTVNLVGTFTVLALAAEVMAAQEPDANGQRGCVVLTASIAAYEGQIGQIAYASSKAGVVGMTLPAARDLAQHGIRVNTIAPGVVETPMMAKITPEFREHLEQQVPFPSRLAQPVEFAQLAAMIIEHDYLNGETIRLDAALRMGPR